MTELRSGILRGSLTRQVLLTRDSVRSAVITDTSRHEAVFNDFVQAIQTGVPPLCDGRDARRTTALVLQIYGY